LLFSGVATVIKGVNVFLDVAGGYRCIRVFKLPAHLDTGACSVVLFGHLYSWSLSLLEGLSCLSATASHKVSIGFPFRSSQNFKEEW
jgi:hypothetical protein